MNPNNITISFLKVLVIEVNSKRFDSGWAPMPV